MIALVQEIYIPHFRPGKDTVVSLLKFIRDGVTVNLKKLTIGDGSLNNINPGLVSRALLKLQDCIIYGAQPGQVQAIFAGIKDSASISLRNLDLIYQDLELAPDMVAGVAMKLETLKARFSSAQVEAIITRLAASEDSRLRQLEIYWPDTVNISSLDPEVVAEALTKLEMVERSLCHCLTAGQVSTLFSRIHHSPDLRLRHLQLRMCNISHLSPLVLIGAIQRLETFDIVYGRMTAEQATAILTMVKENKLGRIKNIKIFRVPGISSVSPSLLQEARLNSALVWD